MRALFYALAWDEEHLRDGRDGSLNLQTSRHAASTKWTSICTGTLREIAKAAILILLLAIGLHGSSALPGLSSSWLRCATPFAKRTCVRGVFSEHT